mgnify:CR=1 FL=1
MSDDLETRAAEYVLGTLPAAERARQVARMLQDPRSARFADAFATQWLLPRLASNAHPEREQS